MRKVTVYFVVKATVEVVDDTDDDDIVDRVVQETDYGFGYKDDVCEIVDTQLIDATTVRPV